MTKELNVDFAELFGGASTPAESLNADTSALLQRQLVPLPFDSDLFDFLPATTSGGAQQIEDAEFVQKISGLESSSSVPKPEPLITAVNTLTKRARDLATREPERQRKIKSIVETARSAAPECLRD